jgi:WD40 repeat protein
VEKELEQRRVELEQRRKKKRFLIVETDFGITSFRIKKGVKTYDMDGHKETIIKIVFIDPNKMTSITKEKVTDDPMVITCSFDNTILLWDFKKMKVITRLETPKHSELTCLTFLYNCCLVATGHEDGAIRLWNMEISSSVLLKCSESQKHKNTISCIHACMWKEVEFLICGSYDGRLSVWEISEKKQSTNDQMNSTIQPQLRHVIENFEKGEFPGEIEILSINFYQSENEGNEGYILVGGNNKKINVYCIRTGLLEAEMEGHEDSVTCMVIDGQILITGSDDTSIRIWNLHHESFKLLSILGYHDERK